MENFVRMISMDVGLVSIFFYRNSYKAVLWAEFEDQTCWFDVDDNAIELEVILELKVVYQICVKMKGLVLVEKLFYCP